MDIIGDLISSLEDYGVRDVRVGVSWTGVWSRNLGVSKTYITGSHSYVKDFDRLTQKSALELARYAYSWNLIEAAIGVAAINSLIQPEGDSANIFDILPRLCSQKKVVIVGMFPKKYVERVRESASQLYILELDPRLVSPEEGIYPATACEYLIPESDVALITGSTLINKSLERLLELAEDTYTIIAGPSTPMTPVMFKYGVDMLAGIRIRDPRRVLEGISRSSGMISRRVYGEAVEYLILKTRK